MSNRVVNGIKMPYVGFGTADLCGDVKEIVKNAIQVGYTLIDTASVYGSEQMIGEAVEELILQKRIKREQLIIQSKLDPNRNGYEQTLECFAESLDNLKTNYLDVYFIHWPVPRGNEENYKEKNIDTWKAFEKLYKDGKVRAIGVCNFLERHILQIEKECQIPPMITQLELHPGYQQRGLVNFCKERGMFIEAWSPMGRGILNKEPFIEMAENYDKNIGQLALRWGIEKGYMPITRTSSKEHATTNLDLLNFSINKDDMKLLDDLNTNDGYDKIWSYKRQQMY